MVVTNQRFTIFKISNFSVPSSFELDGGGIDALEQESRVCRAAAMSGGISGGTPNCDAKKPPQVQVLSGCIRILFAHQYLSAFLKVTVPWRWRVLGFPRNARQQFLAAQGPEEINGSPPSLRNLARAVLRPLLLEQERGHRQLLCGS